MREETPVTRSSLVPVLGCIALLLFGLNFYRFLDRELFSKWHSCNTQDFVLLHDHAGASHDVYAFRSDVAQDALRRAERALRRNLDRATRQLDRLQSKLRFDVDVNVDLERLHEDIRIKRENLERLQHQLHINRERSGSWCETRDAFGDLQRHLRIRLAP